MIFNLKFGESEVQNLIDSDINDLFSYGSFSPELTINNSTTGITYNWKTGKYYKINKLVYIDVDISLSSKGVQSGAVKVQEWPFTPKTGNSSEFVCYTNNVSGINTLIVDIIADSLSSYMYSMYGESRIILYNTNIDDDFRLRFSGTYLTDE